MSFSGSSFGNYTRVYLIVLGAIFLVVGIGIALALGGLPYAGGGMLLMGGIFAIVGGILVITGLIVGRGAASTDRVLQTGIAGTATITGLTQTGVYLNEQPQIGMNLLVQLPGEVPYATNHREFVPLMLLGRLSSGYPLPVRVDQMDRSKLVVDWQNAGFGSAPTPAASAAAAAAAMAGGGPSFQPSSESMAQIQTALAAAGSAGMTVAQPFGTPQQGNYTVDQLRAWLRQNGLQASAHVDRLEDTGQVVGDEHMYKMQMTLNIPGQASQQLPAAAAMVPVAVAHKLFQGMNVPVRYAPDNHDLLMVEWDKL